MTGTSAKRFRDVWLWQATLRPVVTGLIILISIVTSAILFPRFGAMAFITLPLVIVGLLHGVIYGWVTRRAARLREAWQMVEGEIADALIVKGIVQSPGIVILSAAEIHLIPIVGSPATLPLNDIVTTKVPRWFNGTCYPWKTGFWLTIPGESRLGFAVSSSLAGRWRDRLFSN